jgi:hypothetical protein
VTTVGDMPPYLPHDGKLWVRVVSWALPLSAVGAVGLAFTPPSMYMGVDKGENDASSSKGDDDVAGGLLTTATRTQNGARLTFSVDADTDAQTRLVVARPRPPYSYEHVRQQ